MQNLSGFKKFGLGFGLFVVIFAITIGALWFFSRPVEVVPDQELTSEITQNVPELKTEVVASGLTNPWDIVFLSSGSMLIAERGGDIYLQGPGSTSKSVFFTIPDVYAQGEGGLMGMTIDVNYAQNNYLYTCYASTNQDVRVVRWQVNEVEQTLTDKKDIITGIPLNPSGRHSGCRVKMDIAKTLWVGTGDAANEVNPQDPKSLGGKILRVDREGKAAEGNLGGDFDARIFSYGHRNTQGLALYETQTGGSFGFSAEHGSSRDDEINRLASGNFGWDPGPGYDESVNMTDLQKFPDAKEAVWKSGNPTIAVSGIAFLNGTQWKGWNGALVVAVLKDEHIRIQKYSDKVELVSDEVRFEKEFGRIRSVVPGLDGNLYLTTDNGQDDQIIRVTPS